AVATRISATARMRRFMVRSACAQVLLSGKVGGGPPRLWSACALHPPRRLESFDDTTTDLGSDQEIDHGVAGRPCLEHGRRAGLLHAVFDGADPDHRDRR